MSDEELIASLRGKGFSFMEKAADRIEALTAENERLEKQCEGLMQAGMNNGQALILAEAKLAKAVEALRDAVDAWDNHNKTGDMMQGHWVNEARATLFEIEGEKG